MTLEQFEALLKLTSIRSEKIIYAMKMHYVEQVSLADTAREVQLSRASISQAKKTLEGIRVLADNYCTAMYHSVC